MIFEWCEMWLVDIQYTAKCTLSTFSQGHPYSAAALLKPDSRLGVPFHWLWSGVSFAISIPVVRFLCVDKITDTQTAMEGSCALYCCAPGGESCILLQSCVNPITPMLVFVSVSDYVFFILQILKIALENHQMHWTLFKFHFNERIKILMWSKRFHYYTFPSYIYNSLHFGCNSYCWVFSFFPLGKMVWLSQTV